MLESCIEIDSDSENEQTPLSSVVKPRSLVTGKIVSVTLENFMTHTAATMHPGEHLNIVIGPNGTGKSSLVAAIIIGMGGSPKILSARLQLRDYVKNGKAQAKIGVCLYKNEQRNRITFTRTFGRNNKSAYKVNGMKVTETIYQSTIANLHIQVGNLCQFLPQDRVQDFAKQNSQELFCSTQQSICSHQLISTFEKLKKNRYDQTNNNAKRKQAELALKEYEERVNALREHVETITRQDTLIKRKELLKKKVAWMHFERLYSECMEINRKFKMAKQKYGKCAKERHKLEKRAANVANERKKYEQQLEKASGNKQKWVTHLNRSKGKVEKLEDLLHRAINDLRAANELAAEQQRELNENQIILNTRQQEYDEQLATTPSEECIDTTVKKIDNETQALKVHICKLAEVRRGIIEEIENVIRPNIVQVEQKLKVFESVSDAKLDYLQNTFGDTYKSLMWLRENRNLFKHHIYEPMILELNVKNKDYAKYVESCVPIRDLIAFTCENIDDMNLLTQKLRVEMNLCCNLVHSDAATELQYRSRIPIADVQKFGGELYLLDCIDAPASILNYLCKIYKIQDALIGSEILEMNVDQLSDSLRLLFTPTNRIAITVSKYSGEKASMSAPIIAKNILNARISQVEMAKLIDEKAKLIQQKDKCMTKRNETEYQINQKEGELKLKFREKNDVQKKLIVLQDLNTKLKRQMDKAERLQANIVDVDAENGKFKERSQQIIKKMLKMQENRTKLFETVAKCNANEDEARNRLSVFKKSCINIDVQMAESNEEVECEKKKMDEIGQLLDTTKEKCKEKQVEAMKLTENRKPSDGIQFPYKEQFDNLANDITVLTDEIADIEGQTNCRSTADQQTLDEYEERTQRIVTLKKQIENFGKSTADAEKELGKLHKNWFRQITRLINTINQNFGKFMGSMHCAGEVDLIYTAEHDYDSYGIEIRVKYRSSERLRPLDRFVQSGGERAVAIAVYSLALQHLSQVPFRCVDEINQGMDPINEHRVFKMLVNIVAQNGQSQFFYVTPKLLPNLPCNQYVSCITVFNGPYSERNDYFHSLLTK